MISWLRTRWRRLTFNRRVRTGGPLHITFPRDGVYLVTWGDRSEVRECREGETVTFIDFESTVMLRSGLDEAGAQ